MKYFNGIVSVNLAYALCGNQRKCLEVFPSSRVVNSATERAKFRPSDDCKPTGKEGACPLELKHSNRDKINKVVSELVAFLALLNDNLDRDID